MACEYGLDQAISWLGWQADLRDFFGSIDVLLFNSDSDAVPRTPLEAMGYAIPVVASVLHGGLKEIMIDGTTGFLSQEHEVSELASQLVTLIENETLRSVLGAGGRRRVAQTNNPDSIACQYENLLQG